VEDDDDPESYLADDWLFDLDEESLGLLLAYLNLGLDQALN